MNTLLAPLLPLLVCGAAFAADVAPASDQYGRERPAPAAAAPAPNAPVLFSRTVWPRVELSDGRVLERVRVSSEDATHVTLVHAGGIAKVDKRALPPEVAAVHPYTAGTPRPQSPASAPASPSPRLPAAPAPAVTDPAARRVVPTPGPMPGTPSADKQAEILAAKIEVAVTRHARQYYETEKRVGSGQTLSFGVMTDLSEPKEVTGWPNRWEVTGTAGYKVYDSVGWGSFSSRKSKFTAIVETPPGKRPVVVSFDER